MSSLENRRSSIRHSHEAAAPMPIAAGKGRPNSAPRKHSATLSKRRRSSSIMKDGAMIQDAHYSVSMPAPRLSGNMLDDFEEYGEGEEELDDGPDGEVRGKVKGKRTKKGQEVFQCEKCSKWYRHPACLIKHRWQHTEYWAQTSSMMMSKHQSVMMLEAAAILTNGASLPEEKSLWPAAVSPPSSGLLGSEYLNAQILRGNRALESPQVGSLSQMLEPHSLRSNNNDADVEDTLMDQDSEDGTDSRSRSAGRDQDADDQDMVEDVMFAFEMGDSAPTPAGQREETGSGAEDRDSGYTSGDRDGRLSTSCTSSTFGLTYPQYSRQTVQMPRLAPIPHLPPPPSSSGSGFPIMSNSRAPALGFFERRQEDSESRMDLS